MALNVDYDMDKQALQNFVEQQLQGTDYFLVDLTVSAANEIAVTIESLGNADLEKCIELTKAIEDEFSRDEEDYELEVGTAGLTAPFKVKGQYLKNIGNEVEVLTAEGVKLKGILERADDDTFTVVCDTKVKKEGEKRPVIEKVNHELRYDAVKRVNYLLKF